MNLTDDLTNGIIWKQLTALALPLIWGNILQQMYNTIDSFVVGHYIGETAFAAAGVAGSVMNLSLFVISGCCNGIAIIIAELYGQKNWDLLRKESFLSLAFGGGFTIMLSMCGMLTLQPLLRGIQTPAEVAGFVQEYLKIIYLGLPAVFLYNWCAAVLRGAGDTRASLWILLLAMGLNTILDFLFVLSFGLGMAGTAYATVVSQLYEKTDSETAVSCERCLFPFSIVYENNHVGNDLCAPPVKPLYRETAGTGNRKYRRNRNDIRLHRHGADRRVCQFLRRQRLYGNFNLHGTKPRSLQKSKDKAGIFVWITDDGGPGAGIVHNYVFDIRTCCDLVDGGGIWSGFKPCQVLYERNIRLLCPLLPW